MSSSQACTKMPRIKDIQKVIDILRSKPMGFKHEACCVTGSVVARRRPQKSVRFLSRRLVVQVFVSRSSHTHTHTHGYPHMGLLPWSLSLRVLESLTACKGQGLVLDWSEKEKFLTHRFDENLIISSLSWFIRELREHCMIGIGDPQGMGGQHNRVSLSGDNMWFI